MSPATPTHRVAGSETRPVAARLAGTFRSRLRGWMGVRHHDAGAGLWLEPCNAVHTFFMRFPVDILYLARDGTILALREGVKPWRLSAPVWRARAVLELPAGHARAQGLATGRRVRRCAN